MAIERPGMDTFRLLKVAGLAIAGVLALLVLSVLASVLLSLLSIVVALAVAGGVVYLAYRLYAAVSGRDEGVEVGSTVEDLQREFER